MPKEGFYSTKHPSLQPSLQDTVTSFRSCCITSQSGASSLPGMGYRGISVRNLAYTEDFCDCSSFFTHDRVDTVTGHNSFCGVRRPLCWQKCFKILPLVRPHCLGVVIWRNFAFMKFPKPPTLAGGPETSALSRRVRYWFYISQFLPCKHSVVGPDALSDNVAHSFFVTQVPVPPVPVTYYCLCGLSVDPLQREELLLFSAFTNICSLCANSADGFRRMKGWVSTAIMRRGCYWEELLVLIIRAGSIVRCCTKLRRSAEFICL